MNIREISKKSSLNHFFSFLPEGFSPWIKFIFPILAITLCNFEGWHHVKIPQSYVLLASFTYPRFILQQPPIFGYLLTVLWYLELQGGTSRVIAQKAVIARSWYRCPSKSNQVILILLFGKRTDQGISLLGASELQQVICPSICNMRMEPA